METMDISNPAHPGHSDYLISSQGRMAERIFYSDQPMLESVRNKLLNECYNFKEERCGFITLDWDLIKVTNSHEVPRTNFYMRESDAIPAIESIYTKYGSDILGIYHTHPNGYPWPSPRDLVGWPNPVLKWRYFLVSRGDVTEWRLVGG